MQKSLCGAFRKKHLRLRWLFKLSFVLLLYIVIKLSFTHSQSSSPRRGINKVFVEKNQSLFTQYVSTLPAEEFLNYSRCKVRRIGCFMTMKGKAVLAGQIQLTIANYSLHGCGLQCSIKNFRYAALEASNRCFCGTSVTKSYILTQGLLLKDNSNECFLKRHTDVYMLEKCTVKVEDDLSRQVIGCHNKVLLEEQRWIKAFGHKSSATCLLTCEDRGFLLASHNNKKGCYCVNPSPNIGYPRKATSVDASLCAAGSEDYILVMRTYVEDQRCTSKQFLVNGTPLIGLISFPGSGNSWSRHLIELASGYYTGSVFDDDDMYGQGQLGETLDWRSRRTIVIKSHKTKLQHAGLYDKAIFLIRNPYDAIVAEFNRLHGGKTGFASSLHFQSEEWKNFVPYKVNKWLNTVDVYTKSGIPLLVVYFEDLVADTIAVVKAIVKFTGVKIENLEQRLLCVQGDISGNFHRSKVKRNPYTSVMIKDVNKHIKKAREMLKDQHRGYKPLPNYERNVSTVIK